MQTSWVHRPPVGNYCPNALVCCSFKGILGCCFYIDPNIRREAGLILQCASQWGWHHWKGPGASSRQCAGTQELTWPPNRWVTATLKHQWGWRGTNAPVEPTWCFYQCVCTAPLATAHLLGGHLSISAPPHHPLLPGAESFWPDIRWWRYLNRTSGAKCM